MADLSFDVTFDAKGNIEFDIPDNAGAVTGNRALSNRFMILFLSSTLSPLAFGYGGDVATNLTSSSSVDSVAHIAASLKSSCDQTVSNMRQTQEDLDVTEQIASASVDSVNQIQDKIIVAITIIPVALDTNTYTNPTIYLPL